MATISQIKMPNNTTHDIVKNSFYGTCDTAAATAAKVVTLSSDSTGWSLKAGVIIGVKFTNTNSASSVTLNVNGSGAKSIWYNNAVYTGNNNNITGVASRTNYYMYDGAYWVFLHNGIIDSNTDTKVTQTADDSTASDFEVIFSATADNTTRTEAARKSSKLKFNPSTGNLQATQLNGVNIGSSPKFTDTTYENKTAASGGTDVSLVTTGEKYTWNNKSNLTLGTSSSTAYRGDRGNTAYNHSQLTSGNPHNVTKSDVGLGNVPNVTTDNQAPTVTEATTRANLATGDTLKTIIGKIKKFFTDLKTVAFTGSYNDLSDKPTIPTVNNATLTIQKNGTTVKTFTANASSNVTANITVPTKVSELTNDSGFVTTDTKVTQTATTTNADYEVLFSVTADNTTRTEGARKNSNLKFNPSTGTLTATKFSGALSGNADTASKLGTSNVGSNRQPIYLNAGAATAGDYTVAHRGNAGKSNMNDVGRLYPSVGMTNLSDPSNNYDNPMNGTTKSTGWHLYFDTSYSDDPNGTNAWAAQICNKAGSSQWWVRSRSGGTITNGTAWASTWRHLVTSDQAGKGGTTTPIYIDANGDVQNCSYTIAKSVPADAKFTDTNTTYTFATGDSNGQIKVTPSGGTAQNVSVKGLGSNAYTSTSYLPTGGGTMTGQIKLASTGFRTSSDTGYSIDEFGNFKQITAASGANFHIDNTSNVPIFGTEWATGNTFITGNFDAGRNIIAHQYLETRGGDLRLCTSGSSSDDAGDISWYYGNGNEMARIWIEPNNSNRPRYRIFNKSGGNPKYDGWLALMGDICIYHASANTNNKNAVIVTHGAQSSDDKSRNKLYAYGDGNGYPWFMEIMYAYSYVACVTMKHDPNFNIGVRYIDSTHFAIITRNWDEVTVYGNFSDFSVASSTTDYTVDTNRSRLPIPDTTIYTNNTVSNVTLKRVGRMVTLILFTYSDTLSKGGVTIPYGYRPTNDIYFVGKAFVNNADIWSQGYRVTSGGVLTARSTNNNDGITVTYAAASASYITADDYPSS